MIYLKKERVVFLKARKVAGTSFEMALSRFAMKDDIITPISPNDERARKELGFSSCQNYMDKSGAPIFNNHISAADAKKKLGISIWNDAQKITIVRNPFDVYVSLFYYHNGAEADISKLSGWYFDGKGASYLGVNHKQYFIKEEMIVDRFIRYESFEEDIFKVEESMPVLKGLYDTFRNIKAKSGVRDHASFNLESVYFNHPELKKTIRRLHDFEIERFGYSAL